MRCVPCSACKEALGEQSPAADQVKLTCAVVQQLLRDSESEGRSDAGDGDSVRGEDKKEPVRININTLN